jgi:hypothetical protein
MAEIANEQVKKASRQAGRQVAKDNHRLRFNHIQSYRKQVDEVRKEEEEEEEEEEMEKGQTQPRTHTTPQSVSSS